MSVAWLSSTIFAARKESFTRTTCIILSTFSLHMPYQLDGPRSQSKGVHRESSTRPSPRRACRCLVPPNLGGNVTHGLHHRKPLWALLLLLDNSLRNLQPSSCVSVSVIVKSSSAPLNWFFRGCRSYPYYANTWDGKYMPISSPIS